MTHLNNEPTRSADDEIRTRCEDLFVAAPVPGHHQYPTMDMQNIDVVTVELSKDVCSDDLLRGSTRGAPRGEVDDSVHHRQQRVHLMRGKEDRDVLVLRDPVKERDDLVTAADIEICQRFVQQEKSWLTYQRVSDEHTLLLSPRELSDASVCESLGGDRSQHLVDQCSALS